MLESSRDKEWGGGALSGAVSVCVCGGGANGGDQRVM